VPLVVSITAVLFAIVSPHQKIVMQKYPQFA